jgi:hypothetical protein
VNLSTLGSGTHDLAQDVLRFSGLTTRRPDGSEDFVVSTASYEELESRINGGPLPDAIFTVSDLPSLLGRKLVAKRGYELVSLPFGEAYALDAFQSDGSDARKGTYGEDEVAKYRIYPTHIPAFTYGVAPPSPPAPLSTFGPRLLLVAGESVPPRAVRLILEAVFSGDFAQYYRPPLDTRLLELAPEYPWHDGTDEFRGYNKPLLAGDVIDLLEKGTSLAGAIAGAIFFLWQWFRQHSRRKRELGFESYMVKVAAVERQTLELELASSLDLKELLRLQLELNRLKNEAISRFAEGRLEGESLMSGFLTHINDARGHIARLILHERDNLEDRAELENRSPEELWAETVGGTPGSHCIDEFAARTETEAPREANDPQGQAAPHSISAAQACPPVGQTSH